MSRTPLDRRQLEDAQDGRGGGGRSSAACCRGSSTVDGVDVAICVPFTALQARASTRRAARACRSSRRTCTRARGRLHRRGLGADARPSSTSTASSSATPSAASYFGETDKALQRQGPGGARRGPAARSSASARPRTSARPATPSASCATRSRRGSRTSRPSASATSSSPTSRSGRSAPARSRRPSRRRRRSGSSARSSATVDKEQAERPRPLRRQSSSPTTRPSCSRCPTSTARSSAARRSTPGSFAAIVDAAAGERAVPSPCVLVVLDGWGLAPPGPGNAVELADTPVFDELWARYPHTQLTACGAAVGLPDGQMGNSEVGHLNLGAGAVVKQDLTRIDEAVADGSLRGQRGAAGRDARLRARPPDRPRLRRRRALGPRAHLEALIRLARRAAASPTSSSTPSPTAATRRRRRRGLRRRGRGWCRARARARRLGRSGATTRWTATTAGSAPSAALDLLLDGKAEHHGRRPASRPCATPTSATRPTSSSPPTTVGDEARIRPGTRVIAFNFRPDRMRQLTRGARRRRSRRYTTLTEYEEGWPYPVAFPPARPAITLPQVIAAHRRPAAARRRDREVPARDVLLRRRRGGPVRGRAARARAVAARRRRPTTSSRR